MHTTAELESLRNELEESQARALLLEKVASLNKQQGAGSDCEVTYSVLDVSCIATCSKLQLELFARLVPPTISTCIQSGWSY